MGQNGSFAPSPLCAPPPVADAALPRGCPACSRRHFPVLPRLRPEEILQIVTLSPPGRPDRPSAAPPALPPTPGSAGLSPMFPFCHPNKISHSLPAAPPHLSAALWCSAPPGGGRHLGTDVLSLPPKTVASDGGDGGVDVAPTWRRPGASSSNMAPCSLSKPSTWRHPRLSLGGDVSTWPPEAGLPAPRPIGRSGSVAAATRTGSGQ